MIYFDTEHEIPIKLDGCAATFYVRPLSYKNALTSIQLQQRMDAPDTPFAEQHRILMEIVQLVLVRTEPADKPLDDLLTVRGMRRLLDAAGEAMRMTPEDMQGFPSPHGSEPASCAAPVATDDATTPPVPANP